MSRTAPEIQAEIHRLTQELVDSPATAVANAARIQALVAELTTLPPAIHTQGGSVVEGEVQTGGGDFVGRDQNIAGDLVKGNKVVNQAPDPAREARQTYLKRLRDHCHALPLTAMGDDQTTGESLGLDTVYIALDTQTRVPLTEEQKAEREKEPWRFDNREDLQSRPLTALEAAAQHPRLVLLGDPGSGKSSFVRQLAADHAAAALASQPNALLPLFMVLRDLAPRLRELPPSQPLTQAVQNALVQAITDQWEVDIAQLGGRAYAEQRLAADVTEGRVLLIFDGLDELPEESRPVVWAAVNTLLSRHRQVAQVIVTCRVRSYTGTARFPAFADHTLAPFSKAKIQAFIVGWYDAQAKLGRFKPNEAQERTRDLQTAATREDLLKLAENPLLLTVMAIIHQKETRLPNERVKLYSKAVEILLRRWQQDKGAAVSPALEALLHDDLQIRPLLERLAYDLHEKQARQTEARLQWGDLFYILQSPAYLGDVALAKEFLTYIDQRTGLLVGHGGSHAAESEKPPEFDFPHRTFQEYLAGCHLLEGYHQEVLPHLHTKAQSQDYWRIPVQLGLEELHFNRRRQGDLVLLAQGLLTSPEATPRTHLWSGYVADLVGVPRIAADLAKLGMGGTYPAQLQQALLAIVQDDQQGQLALLERAEAGQLLNLVADPRRGVGVRDGLPDLVWGGEVVTGPYTIGGDGQFDGEIREVTIETVYQVAKYPITYAQFQCFVEAEDFGDAKWWEGMPEKQADSLGQVRVIKEIEPNPSWPHANHPRVEVSWYQAVAFCRWLTVHLGYDQAGYEVRLPHEHEWEVAARYQHDRIYPWGEDAFDPAKANTWEGKVRQTTAVGLYPSGRQPHLDLYDLSGNVFEWCQNKRQDPTQTEVDDSGASRGLRGGSWVVNDYYARAAYRFSDDPLYRFGLVGLRVVRVPRPPSLLGH